jgi:hypothetical protein
MGGDNMQTKKLSTLKGLFCLDHNLRVYIPTTTKTNQVADTESFKQEALKKFSTYFGGATSYDAVGAWLSGSKGLVTERVTIVESYATKDAISDNLQAVIEFAGEMKKKLAQEAVSLEYDSKLYFV